MLSSVASARGFAAVVAMAAAGTAPLALGGCGQKGPLVLPGTAASAQPRTAPAPAPAPAARPASAPASR